MLSDCRQHMPFITEPVGVRTAVAFYSPSCHWCMPQAAGSRQAAVSRKNQEETSVLCRDIDSAKLAAIRRGESWKSWKSHMSRLALPLLLLLLLLIMSQIIYLRVSGAYNVAGKVSGKLPRHKRWLTRKKRKAREGQRGREGNKRSRCSHATLPKRNWEPKTFVTCTNTHMQTNTQM